MSGPDRGPLRVLIACDWFPPSTKAGGPPRSLAGIVELEAAEYQIHVLTRDRDLGDRAPYPSEVITGSLRPGAAEVQRVAPRIWPTACALRATGGVDILYLNSIFSALYAILPLLLTTIRLMAPSLVLIAPRGETASAALRIGRTKKSAAAALIRLMIRRLDVVWHASNEREAVDIARFAGPAARIVVLADPAPPPASAPDFASCDPALLAFVGRMVPIKNFELVVSALAMLNRPVELSVLGTIEDERYWSRCLSRLERAAVPVRLTVMGHRDAAEVRAVLRRSVALVLPTRGENFGHAIAEAMAEGCPPLIPDTTLWTPLILRGGGRLIDPDDPRPLAAALAHVLAMPAEDRTKQRELVHRVYHQWWCEERGARSLFDQAWSCARDEEADGPTTGSVTPATASPSVRSHVLIAPVTQVIAAISTALTALVAARQHQYADIGAYAAGVAICAVVSGLISGGTSLQFITGDADTRAAVRLVRRRFIAPTMALCAVMISLIYHVLVPHVHITGVLLGCATVTLSNLVGLETATLQKHGRMLAWSAVTVGSRLLSLGALALGAPYSLGMTAGAAAAMAGSWQLARGLEPGVATSRRFGNLLRTAYAHRSLGLIAWLDVAMLRLPFLVAPFVADVQTAGVFATLLSAQQSITGLLTSGLFTIMTVRGEPHRRPAGSARLAHARSEVLLIAVAVPIAAAGIAFAPAATAAFGTSTGVSHFVWIALMIGVPLVCVNRAAQYRYLSLCQARRATVALLAICAGSVVASLVAGALRDIHLLGASVVLGELVGVLLLGYLHLVHRSPWSRDSQIARPQLAVSSPVLPRVVLQDDPRVTP